jgi:hypothetical protein
LLFPAIKNFHNLKNSLITDLYLGEYKNPYLLVKLNDSITDNVLFDTGAGEFFTPFPKWYLIIFYTDFDSTKINVGYGACGYGVNGIEEISKKHRVTLNNLIFCATEFKNVSTIPANSYESRIGVYMLHTRRCNY